MALPESREGTTKESGKGYQKGGHRQSPEGATRELGGCYQTVRRVLPKG